jgi:hypothetical protein
MRYARSLDGDCTYNQRAVFDFYKDQVSLNKTDFFRVDLSAATDRLPLRIQEAIIGKILQSSSMASL